MLELDTPFDLQLELSQFIREMRKHKKLSVKALVDKSGVPDSTIRKFEATGEISLRQFLMLYAAIAPLKKVKMLTEMEVTPKSIDEVLKSHAKS